MLNQKLIFLFFFVLIFLFNFFGIYFLYLFSYGNLFYWKLIFIFASYFHRNIFL